MIPTLLDCAIRDDSFRGRVIQQNGPRSTEGVELPSMSTPSREQFVEQVLQCVAERFPLVKVARGEAPFSMKVNGHVASLENLYRSVALHPDESRHQIERWIVELLRAAEGSPDRT